jgi:hypothetical protein
MSMKCKGRNGDTLCHSRLSDSILLSPRAQSAQHRNKAKLRNTEATKKDKTDEALQTGRALMFNRGKSKKETERVRWI